MGKHNIVSGFLVLVVVVMIAIATIVVVDYTKNILSAAMTFMSSDQVAKLQACGVTVPPQIVQVQYDLQNILLPAIYVGFPGLMVIIAILMYLAGYYHGETSSETTTTTSSPNRNRGRYARGRHVVRTRTVRRNE
jgi:hypothetical protein